MEFDGFCFLRSAGSHYDGPMEATRVRVLVTAFAAVPGCNQHAAALLAMAQGLRADIDLVTLKIPNLAHQSRVGETRLFRVPASGTRREQGEAFARAVKRQAVAEAYDIVHARGPIGGAALLDSFAEEPPVFVYEATSFEDTDCSSWQRAHQRCLEAADLVLVSTDAAARRLGEDGHAGKVAVVPPAINLDAYDWWPSAHQDTLRLLYLGGFEANRDLETMLDGIAEASRRFPVRALLAGEPQMSRRVALQQKLRDRGLHRHVEVRGEPRAEAIPSLIAGCDVALVPAGDHARFFEHGDLPAPLLEHLACCRPVIATATPAIREFLGDEEQAILVPPADAEALADAIVAIATDRSTAERLAAQGYEHVRQRFSAAARRRRIAEVYELLMPGSQSYDAWREAFDEDGSGSISLPDAPDAPDPETNPSHQRRAKEELPPSITRVDTSPRVPAKASSDTTYSFVRQEGLAGEEIPSGDTNVGDAKPKTSPGDVMVELSPTDLLTEPARKSKKTQRSLPAAWAREEKTSERPSVPSDFPGAPSSTKDSEAPAPPDPPGLGVLESPFGAPPTLPSPPRDERS